MDYYKNDDERRSTIKVELKPRITDDGKLVIERYSSDLVGEMVASTVAWELDAKEQIAHDYLVKSGWTPPSEDGASETLPMHVLKSVVSYTDLLGGFIGSGCEHGFKPAKSCTNPFCEARRLHVYVDAVLKAESPADEPKEDRGYGPADQERYDAEKAAFEQWYTKNAFDYERDPIGSRDCGIARAAWHGALAELRERMVGRPFPGLVYGAGSDGSTVKVPDYELIGRAIEAFGAAYAPGGLGRPRRYGATAAGVIAVVELMQDEASGFDRAPETPRRQQAVEKLLAMGWRWDHESGWQQPLEAVEGNAQELADGLWSIIRSCEVHGQSAPLALRRAHEHLSAIAHPRPTGGESPDPKLCEFYSVIGWLQLMGAMEEHILRLQDAARSNVKPFEDTFPPTLLPKYLRDTGLIDADQVASYVVTAPSIGFWTSVRKHVQAASIAENHLAAGVLDTTITRTYAVKPAPTGEQAEEMAWYFVSIDDDGRPSVTYCPSPGAIELAAREWMGGEPDAECLSDDDEDMARGVRDELLQQGVFRPEGDPPCYLLPAAVTEVQP